MKKHLSILLVLVMVFSCLALVSCGKKDEGKAPSADSKYIGVWKATTGEFNGEEASMDEVLQGGTFVLDLRADGTAIVTTDKEDTGTWTEIEGGIHVKAGETDTDFAAEGDNLVIKILGFSIIFEKQ